MIVVVEMDVVLSVVSAVSVILNMAHELQNEAKNHGKIQKAFGNAGKKKNPKS